jgi:hypothetical protein
MFRKCDPYRVWCSIFYSKLVNCILLRSLFVFVKGRGTCGRGERNVKIWIDFRKSPRFSLTSPLSQESEKSSRPVFTMCGEPCARYEKLLLISNMTLHWQILDKHTIIDMLCSKWTSHCISQLIFCLLCDIAIRHPFSQNQSTIVYKSTMPGSLYGYYALYLSL